MVTVGAIADVHSPKFLEDFKRVLRNSPDVDLMLLAGDMIYKGRVDEYHNVINVIKERYGNCKIVACFGNEEYEDRIEEIRRRYDNVTWLNDETLTLEVNNLKIGIVGTKGSLDRPTTWQRRNIPHIDKIYEERLKKISDLLSELKAKNLDFIILLSHYSVTFKTLIGEPRWAWPELGSSKFEGIIKRLKPNLAIHGHAHNSKVHTTSINGTQIYNVSFPATRKLTIIKLQLKEEQGVDLRQATLTSFIKR